MQPCRAAGKGFGGVVAKPPPAKKQKAAAKPLDVAKWELQPRVCPCGSGRNYVACCEKYHAGEAIELTAEALMRARFSAYAKGKVDYLVATTHPDNHAQGGSKLKGEVVSTMREDMLATFDKVRWLQLRIVKKGTGPGAHEDEAFVKFVTRFKFKNQAGQRQKGTRTEEVTERSRFLRDAASRRWLYLEGDSSWTGHKYQDD